MGRSAGPNRLSLPMAAVLVIVLLLTVGFAFGPAPPRSRPGALASTSGTVLAATARPSVADYQVSFAEYSLPLGATWYVNVSGQPSLSAVVSISSGTTLSANLTNGSYSYTAESNVQYFVAPGAPFNVSGTPLAFNVLYGLQPGIYEVIFLETGIAGGTNWSVTYNGTTQTAFAPNSVSFYTVNGTFHFSITPVPTYTSNITEGNLTIQGMGRVLEIGFHGPPGPSGGSGSGFPWTWLLAGVIGAGVILLVVWISVVTRSKPDAPQGNSPGAEPPSGPPPAPP